jgi:hypothetical protein
MSTELLADWTPEPLFVPRMQDKIGKGSRSTLQRWRREKTVPEIFEWMKVGRVVLWRERPETKRAPAR